MSPSVDRLLYLIVRNSVCPGSLEGTRTFITELHLRHLGKPMQGNTMFPCMSSAKTWLCRNYPRQSIHSQDVQLRKRLGWIPRCRGRGHSVGY